ncbi:MAG: prepilin-type N-terminal cleavage/methylation domain-containing protein [bacterium]|nr:prepilin-type N-terminal cleavage/methylation domain-containing protein [bacterium]
MSNVLVAKRREGQSLIELIIAIAIGAIMIIGAITLISPSLKSNSDTVKRQTAGTLAKELLENARVLAEANWHNIDSLATTSANVYYVNATSSPFTVASGEQTLAVGSTTYRRSFYLDTVYRDDSAYITGTTESCTAGSGICPDPSTFKVTISFGWSGGPTSTIVDYFTRIQHSVFTQGEWAGGGVAISSTVVTNATNTFTTSTNIDYTSSSQSIEVDVD